jgi:hypothetical protein
MAISAALPTKLDLMAVSASGDATTKLYNYLAEVKTDLEDLSDGTINSTDIVLTGTATANSFTDGTATLTGGALSGLVSFSSATFGSTGACTLDSGGSGSSFGGALTVGSMVIGDAASGITGPASSDFFLDAGADGILELRSAAGTTRMKMDNTGLSFFGATPVARQSKPAAAAGTDAAIIDAIVAALENLGLMA